MCDREWRTGTPNKPGKYENLHGGHDFAIMTTKGVKWNGINDSKNHSYRPYLEPPPKPIKVKTIECNHGPSQEDIKLVRLQLRLARRDLTRRPIAQTPNFSL